jgi:hypothetical protein
MNSSFGLKSVALAVAIMGIAVANSAAQCTHSPQVVVSNAGPGPWTGSHTFTGTEANTIDTTPEIGDGLCFVSGATDQPEVVFQFTAPATDSYSIDTLTSTLGANPSFADTKLWIFTDCSNPQGTSVACNDDAFPGETLSQVVAPLSGGVTYFVAIEAWDFTGVGQIANLNIDVAPLPPANDLCSNATPLTLPFAEDVNLAFCNDEGLDNSVSAGQGGGLGRDVFYTFTPATTGNFIFLGQDVDSGLAYYTGTCGSLTEVGALDDFIGPETATWNLTSGTAYTLMAEGFDASVTGTMRVAFNAESSTPSTGFDDCATPHDVTVSPFVETGVDISGNLNYLNWGGQSAAGDQIYRFTAPSAGDYTFLASPTSVGFDAMMIGLQDECVNFNLFEDPTSISNSSGAFNGTPGSGDESFESIMTAGQSIIVYVQDFNFFGGTMDFSITGTSSVADWSTF